ncbi:MAG: DUF4340 domain-containing protein [Bacteroidia bacterium]|nr:DUF4340 domain-containing protein [Bacteroidia bacterium]
MKKNSILWVTVILLAAIAAWVWYSKTNTTLKKEMKDFAVTDTANITKVVITSKTGQSAILEREGAGMWKVNDTYPARNDAMNNLLESICKVQVRNPVGKRAEENITKSLASGSTKVEIYLKGELHKVYYVGGETPDQEGTYMLLHDHKEGVNAEAPFVVHLPGFVGYLSPRYFTDAKVWRDKILYRFDASTLRKVEVVYYRSPDSTFSVELTGMRTVKVFDKNGNELSGIDSVKTRQYLSYFSSVNYEGIEVFEKVKTDSITGNAPVHRVTATDVNGKSTVLTTYPKAPTKKSDDLVIKGKTFTEDPDRMWGTINNNKNEIILVQFYVIGKLLQSPAYFMAKGKPVNK